MSQFLSLFFLLCFITGLKAQDGKLTIQQAVIGQWREFYPTNLRNLQWLESNQHFTFQDSKIVYQNSLGKNDSLELINLSQLNVILKSANIDTLSYIPYINWESADEFSFYSNNTWIVFSALKKQITHSIQLPAEAENKVLFFAKKMIAFTIKNNLFLMGTDNQLIQVTHDDDDALVNGQTVSRNEFGIDGGIFWSPKGNFVAFYHKDERNVGNYPLVNISAREAEPELIKYPMAGMASEHISVGIFDLSKKSTVFIEKEDTLSEKYLTNITWNPEETSIYIQVLNRDQNHMKMNRYNICTGGFETTLFEEKHDKYVEPMKPVRFLPANSQQFIYQSRRNGFSHLYLYTIEGQLVRSLTQGNFDVIDLVKVGKKNVYVVTTEVSPLERQLYKIEIATGKKTQLTHANGTHKPIINEAETFFIDQFSSINVPSSIDLVSNQGKIKRNILTSLNPLASINLPKMEIGTIKAADGKTDLYYRILKPNDFDSTRKYPTVVYVYGGPHDQLVENNWLGGAGLWDFYMAQNGYIMFTLDNRGSANRGLEFENVIHRQCGVNEMKDQVEGINFLKSLGYADMDRIGVHGWSYGGFMTTSLMVNYPKIFKVGVAGGPVIDWNYYEVMYGERYMDTPAQNPEGYLFTSLIPRAKNLEGKLLIIHGAMDNTVVWQHSQLFLNECIKNQVPVDYFVYPKAEHNVRGFDRVHLMQKVTNYFKENL